MGSVLRWALFLAIVLVVLTLPFFLVSDLDETSAPGIHLDGPEETVFDWTDDACEMQDYPDYPARAFRDVRGNVRLIAGHFTNRSLIGPTLDRVRASCHVVLGSKFDPDPARFDDKNWIGSTYAVDGGRVFALIHHEYQGNTHAGRCPSGDYAKCWYNAITSAVSHDGGVTFSQPPPPDRIVASVPYRYQPDAGPYGLFEPSNIVRNPEDGYFYVFFRAEKFGEQPYGSCLMRTRRLQVSTSWRAWDGDGFRVRFVNPYRAPPREASDQVCTPVAVPEISGMTDSLTYNTFLKKFVLVGPARRQQPGKRDAKWGFYFSVSDDLLSWSPRKLIAEAELLWTYRCGDRNPVMHPSVIDSDSRSRNFLTAGERAYLYFVRFHYIDCKLTADRDLVRIPIRFSK